MTEKRVSVRLSAVGGRQVRAEMEGIALHLTAAIARPAARDESSARRAIAQPAPKGVNDHRAPVAVG